MAQWKVVTNAREVAARLRAKPKQIDDGLARALTKAAFLVEGAAKRFAPVDTGRLRASIQSEVKPTQAIVMPTVKYAIYVHEGTRYMRKRPFLKRGKDAVNTQINAIFKKEVGNALK